VEFGRIVGLYIATLFVVWQIINLLVFRTPPGLPVWVGGTLVVAADSSSRSGAELADLLPLSGGAICRQRGIGDDFPRTVGLLFHTTTPDGFRAWLSVLVGRLDLERRPLHRKIARTALRRRSLI